MENGHSLLFFATQLCIPGGGGLLRDGRGALVYFISSALLAACPRGCCAAALRKQYPRVACLTGMIRVFHRKKLLVRTALPLPCACGTPTPSP